MLIWRDLAASFPSIFDWKSWGFHIALAPSFGALAELIWRMSYAFYLLRECWLIA